MQLTPGNSFTLESCLIVHLHRLGAGLPFMGLGKGATSKHENQAIKRGAGPFSTPGGPSRKLTMGGSAGNTAGARFCFVSSYEQIFFLMDG